MTGRTALALVAGGRLSLNSFHHWDGAAWARIPGQPGGHFSDIWGSPSSGLWVVGEQGAILRYERD